MAETKTYEVIAPVDFGYRLDPTTRVPKDEQPSYAGLHEPTGEGSDNPTVDLPDDLARPLLAAGSIKPHGEDAPGNLPTMNPEEDGYLGEEIRTQAMENDPVYTETKGSEGGSTSTKAKGTRGSKNNA